MNRIDEIQILIGLKKSKYLKKYALSKKETIVWVTSYGQRIRVCDMDDKHLLNTINYLERKAQLIRVMFEDYAYEVGPSYRAMIREARKRGLNVQEQWRLSKN